MLRGRLEDFALTDMMRLISNAAETGVLHVRARSGTGRIVFADGTIRFAETPRSRGFGRDLVDRGAITNEQLARLIRRCAETGEALEEALAETGWVAAEELEEALRRELENALAHILSWTEGDFHFEMGLQPERGFRHALDVSEVPALAARTQDFDATVPVRSFRVVSGGRDASVVLTADEWRLVAAMDGRATVGEVARRAGLSRPRLGEMLERLTSRGIVELVSPEEARVIDLRDPTRDAAGAG